MPDFDSWWMRVLRWVLGHAIDIVLGALGRKAFL